MNSLKIAFLDRDGTIIEDYEDSLWRHVSEPVFIEGAIDALKAIIEKGFQIIIITNQYIINEEIITLSQYQEFTIKFINKLIENRVEILDIFYCPHTKEEGCNCMKPKDGMIKMALEKYADINLDESFIIGDSMCDIQLGKSLGIKTFGIKLKDEEEKVVTIDSLKYIGEYL